MNFNISGEQIFVGIDVAKDHLDIFVDSTETYSQCQNRPQDLTKLARQLKKLKPRLIVLEASGGYEKPAALAFTEHELPFSIVYPKRVRQFARGLGIMAKTDKIDAKIISYYGKIAKIKAKPLQSKELRTLNALTTRRQQLTEMRLSEENRLETVDPSMKRNIKKHVTWLANQIASLENDIEDLVKRSEIWQQTTRQLRAVPGVGPVLSSTLITDLPELGQVSNKEIASLVGVAPFACESGRHKGQRFCKGGRNSVRRVLYMATLAAVRCNPIIKEFYERLCERGKLKKVALIACARKLLVILNTMMKHNCDWEPKITTVSA